MTDVCLDQLENLEWRVAAVLRGVPGATALACFGSRASGASDEYADLDVLLVTEELEAARAVWPSILAHVGPIRYALRLDEQPGSTSYSIAFQGASPYHKLDVSLVDTADAARMLDAQPHRWLWRQIAATRAVERRHLDGFIPPFRSSGHMLLDELVSLVRYTKARKRQQHLTCWRFARAAFDTLLRLWAGAQHGVPAQLSTWDYVALDQRTAETERLGLLAALDWSTPARMDHARLALGERIIAALRERARGHGEPIPTTIAEETLAFVRKELGVDA